MYRNRNIFNMKLINFVVQFPDVESCKLKFKAMQHELVITFRHCGGNDNYSQKTYWMLK